MPECCAYAQSTRTSSSRQRFQRLKGRPSRRLSSPQQLASVTPIRRYLLLQKLLSMADTYSIIGLEQGSDPFGRIEQKEQKPGNLFSFLAAPRPLGNWVSMLEIIQSPGVHTNSSDSDSDSDC